MYFTKMGNFCVKVVFKHLLDPDFLTEATSVVLFSCQNWTKQALKSRLYARLWTRYDEVAGRIRPERFEFDTCGLEGLNQNHLKWCSDGWSDLKFAPWEKSLVYFRNRRSEQNHEEIQKTMWDNQEHWRRQEHRWQRVLWRTMETGGDVEEHQKKKTSPRFR